MSPTDSDLALATFVRTHQYLSFVYYAKIAWPYLLLAFVLGSIPFGLIIGRVFFKSDIRSVGSGNIGAANAARTYGRGAGIAVLVLDAAKGIAAVLLVRVVMDGLLSAKSTVPLMATPLLPNPPYAFGDTPIALELATMSLAALAAVLGHCFSPWLGFKGGKGVATFLGASIALGVTSPTIFVSAWILLALRPGYASLASVVATAAVTLYVTAVDYDKGDGTAVVFVIVAFVVILTKHAPNIARIRAGTEPKIAFGSSEGPSGSNGKRVGSI